MPDALNRGSTQYSNSVDLNDELFVMKIDDDQVARDVRVTFEAVKDAVNGTAQTVRYYVKNGGDATIAKGQAVRFAGTEGNSGHLLIARFIADATYPSQYFMGLTETAIAPGEFGYVMHFGELQGIKTNYGDWDDGDLLYASADPANTTHGLTNDAPSAPNNIILVAAIVSAKKNGAVFVRPTLGSRLEYDESVLITDPQDGDILVYNSAQGVWINQQPS